MGVRRGRVRLGATPSVCVSIVPTCCAISGPRTPTVDLQLAEGGSRDLERSLAEGGLDLA